MSSLNPNAETFYGTLRLWVCPDMAQITNLLRIECGMQDGAVASMIGYRRKGSSSRAITIMKCKMKC